MDPKGGLSEHLRGARGRVLLQTNTNASENKNKHPNTNKYETQENTPKMIPIGCLGGHAPSGENPWVEGAEGRAAGQRGEG